jgi:hypothetical protein
MKNSTNGKEPIGTPRPNLGAKKLRRSDINYFNPYGNQGTQFVSFIESLDAPNSSYNHKKTSNTSKVGPTMCISSTNKGKTQVRWVVIIGKRCDDQLV